MACWTVKAQMLGGDGMPEIRRFSCSSATTFHQLYQKIKVMFPELLNRHFSLHWKDEDGDFVSFSSDEEMSEFSKNLVDGYLKIFVKVHIPFTQKPNFGPTGSKLSEVERVEFMQYVAAGLKIFLDYMTTLGKNGSKVSRNGGQMESDDVIFHSTPGNESEKSNEADSEAAVQDQDTDTLERKHDSGSESEEKETMKQQTDHKSSSPEDTPKSSGHIDEAMQQLISMGFHNEGGWLLRLLEEKDGRIDDVLEDIFSEEYISKTRRQNQYRSGLMCTGCSDHLSDEEVWYRCPLRPDVNLCQHCMERGVHKINKCFWENESIPFKKVFQHLGKHFDEDGDRHSKEKDESRSYEEEFMKTFSYVFKNISKVFPGMFVSKPKPENAKPKSRETPRSCSKQKDDDSEEVKMETTGNSDVDVDGPAAGTDSSKNDGQWTFLEDDILQTEPKQELEGKTETETNACQADKPQKAEQSPGFEMMEPPSDPMIAESLTEMMSMGFHNDGGWLQCLLEEKDGNIEKVLDIIQKSAKENK
ncbi:sequestosome-1-like [Saccostrea echinata]|uniref:sequestosome-1-like n=1 Tax=Saccostrea echinata TaxID=191078 RepID=UPI002A81655E|nr:sequestosome-1-like [Saccostrea echinata]